MSRFSVDPRWLTYLPPTMSPVAASTCEGLLEHPDQAFEAYRTDGVDQVVCEEKHMGSRAVVLLCRDGAARDRFGYAGSGNSGGDLMAGVVWTRTGRSFFDSETSAALVTRLRAAAEAAGLFDELATLWLLLDAELMPWSAKAEESLRSQYAAVGAAARAGLGASADVLR